MAALLCYRILFKHIHYHCLGLNTTKPYGGNITLSDILHGGTNGLTTEYKGQYWK
jgi:hypothetical protein